jgi:hypothetical protein
MKLMMYYDGGDDNYDDIVADVDDKIDVIDMMISHR